MTREKGLPITGAPASVHHGTASSSMVGIETTGGVETICLLEEPPARFGGSVILHGRWRQRDVLLKAFPGASADRELGRYVRGLALAAEVGISVPGILHDGLARSGVLAGARCLVLECPPGLRPVGIHDIDRLFDIMEQIHARGLRLRHPRLNGFMVADGVVYMVDGSEVSRRMLPGSPVFGWARLLARFDASSAYLVNAALTRLARQRHWSRTRLRRIRQYVAAARWRRTRRFMRKITRESSLVRLSRGPGFVYLSPRQEPEIDLPYDLDWYFEHGDILKADDISTVVRHDGLVIKRDNRRGILHVLRHNLKSSRARRCWRGAHLLYYLGIPTARPRALVEYRKAGLRTRSYFIADEIQGIPLDRYVQSLRTSSPDPDEPGSDWPPLLNALEDLFTRLAMLRITTHDTKASNVMVCGDGIRGKGSGRERDNGREQDNGREWDNGEEQERKEKLTLSVIDLDRASHHRWAWSFARARRRDYLRFIKSWENRPEDIQTLGPTFMNGAVVHDHEHPGEHAEPGNPVQGSASETARTANGNSSETPTPPHRPKRATMAP